MTNPTKQEILALFETDIETRKKKIVEFFQDTNNSYEDRLEVWKNTPSNLQTEHGWVIHLTDFEKKHGEISWYDDFYVERYSIFDLTEATEYSGAEDWDEEKLKDFYENCMKEGVHTFKMDW
jgi:hypothetical protein